MLTSARTIRGSRNVMSFVSTRIRRAPPNVRLRNSKKSDAGSIDVGAKVTVGNGDGLLVGVDVGKRVGSDEGAAVGGGGGAPVGAGDGSADGMDVGRLVG